MEPSPSVPPGSENGYSGADGASTLASAAAAAGGSSADPRHTRGRSREYRGSSGPGTGAATGMLGGDVIQVDMAALADVLGELLLY